LGLLARLGQLALDQFDIETANGGAGLHVTGSVRVYEKKSG
jgi:hypothetical protein